jgi:hypothetical protein
MTILAPALASPIAIALPMPLFPPVTMAILFCRGMMSLLAESGSIIERPR